jgi:hypothetical protein
VLWSQRVLVRVSRARQNARHLERSKSRLAIFLHGEAVPEDWEIDYSELAPLLHEPIAEGAFAYVYKVPARARVCASPSARRLTGLCAGPVARKNRCGEEDEV